MNKYFALAGGLAAGIVFAQSWLEAGGGRSGTVWRLDTKSVATVTTGPKPRLVAAVRSEKEGAVIATYTASVDPAGCAAPRGLLVLANGAEVVEVTYGRDDGSVAQSLAAHICRVAGTPAAGQPGHQGR
jgi:hypothetical protein